MTEQKVDDLIRDLAPNIAAINIEAVYHTMSGGDYRPFEGICLTDTFQLYEQERDLISNLMADNSNRRTRQKALDIRVIMGNPPNSVGQGCGSAWKRDPGSGVIGVEKGPLIPVV